MFNLDRAIAEWRRQMQAAGIKAPVPLDELESHLRDDVQQQAGSGLSELQAFEAAVQRVGQADLLKAEFEKAGETKRARERKLIGLLTVGCACIYSLFAGSCLVFKLGSFSDLDLGQQMSGLAATALTGLLLVSGWFGQRFFPAIPGILRKRTLMGIAAAGGVLILVWLSIFYHLVMTRFEFNTSQLLVAILWAWTPMGALCGVLHGLEQAAYQKTGWTGSSLRRRGI